MTIALAAGFAQPVHDAQRAFKALMWANARPGLVQDLVGLPDMPAPLTAELATLALTLLDGETTVWLDPALAAEPAVARTLAFHTGVRTVTDPAEARFALITDPAAMLPFERFAQGLHAYPDRSTTLLVAVSTIGSGPRYCLTGPGLPEPLVCAIADLPAGFVAARAANHATFPCGVDLIITAPGCALGLPRTTRIIAVED
jgi:alpha-D-ribose 1-methylphosphonate 5-triphosphate synthase subunit PhnH